MPEIRLSISNPRASGKVVKVKAKADENIQVDQSVNEKRELPIAKVNPDTLKEIGENVKVITLRFKGEADKKIKIHLKAIPDNGVEKGVVNVPMDILANAVGELEAEGEMFEARAWQIVLDEEKSQRLIGLKINDEIPASMVGLEGKLVIRGGSDSSGFPMRPDINGGVKKRVLLSGPPGYRPRNKGERRRKTVRGNTITQDIVQVNVKWVTG